MTPADLPAVAALEVSLFADPWSEQMLIDELTGQGRTYLVARNGGDAIVGYGGVMIVGEDAHVMTIGVVPRHRREGIATRLLLRLVEAALAGGARHLTLEVRQGNAAAIALYERFGFVRAGVRPGYYRDGDAVVMWVKDADGPGYRALLDRIEGEMA
jgi:ribosomal-protein-alanine acetyltransferase